MEKQIKKIYLRPFKMEVGKCQGLPGLVLKRDVTVREAKYIMGEILQFVLPTKDECDAWEYKEENAEIAKTLNEWLRGKIDDHQLMCDYAWDCSDEPLGALYIIPVIAYLQKRNVL